MGEAAAGPLAGIKVLELGRLVAAPLCGQILGDLGADVVKVEQKGVGDSYRHYGPAFLKDADGAKTAESSSYLSVNRNKRSMELDFADPADLATVRALAAQCDVFIENFKVGDLAKYGLDQESITKANPNVIYLSVTGFGQTGPYAQRPGTDGVCQALSGFQSITGEEDRPPQRVGVVVIDLLTGVYAAVSVLAALRHREVLGGGGQAIDAALLDTAMAMTANRSVDYAISGEVPRRHGNRVPGLAPSQLYGCRDGEVFVQAAWDDHFRRLCNGLGRPDLAADPRFGGWDDRVANEAALNAELEAEFRKRTTGEASDLLEAAGILHAPVNTIPQALENPQVVHRGLQVRTNHPLQDDIPLIASPIRLSKTPITYRRPPPMLGEHTDEIIRDWLGGAAPARD